MNKACDINFENSILKKKSVNSMELLKAMLEKDPSKRMSAIDCLKHEYFSEVLETDELAQKMILLYN